MPNPYGLIIFLAIIGSLYVVKLFVNKKDAEIFWELALYTLLCGLIGARLYHVLNFFSYYIANPLKIFEIWGGGLGIWGAFLGGALGATLYLKHKKQNIPYWLDLISVSLPLAQAVGRWGNFFNQEIFGLPTNLPWGIYIKPENRLQGFRTFATFHPLFLYESLLDLFLFCILFSLYKRYKDRVDNGVFTAIYLGSYSTIRFFLEYLRINPWKVAGLNVSQCISILVLAFSIVFIRKKAIK